MNATAQANAETPLLDPVYGIRDDIARTHSPVTPYERMLLTAAAQAWQRFQQALDLEKRLFAKTDPLDLFSTNLAAFKSITRHVSVCDSAFRRAMEQLECTQRSRAREDLGCGRPRSTAPDPQNRPTENRPTENCQNEPKRASAASSGYSQSAPSTSQEHRTTPPPSPEPHHSGSVPPNSNAHKGLSPVTATSSPDLTR